MLFLPSTRAAALERLSSFQRTVARYDDARSVVHPDHEGVSRLSLALRHRLVTEREVVQKVSDTHGLHNAQKFVQEVCWRMYNKGRLEAHPHVWADYRDALTRIRQSASEATLERAAMVAGGESGVAVMDAFAKELLETGYLHHRARMWWASFWIHVEGLPWQLGADWFLRHLHDADPATNTLNWRWVAGLQGGAQPYVVRRAHLERLCAPIYLQDEAGLERLDAPKVRPLVVPESRRRAAQVQRDYPSAPFTASERFGVWVHGEDCHIESTPLNRLRPQAIAAFSVAKDERHSESAVERLRDVVLTDTVARAVRWYDTPGRVYASHSLADSLRSWAMSECLSEIHTMAPFIGPLADEMPHITRSLASHGITLRLLRRPWDKCVLPLASGSFFRFFKDVQPFLPLRMHQRAQIGAS